MEGTYDVMLGPEKRGIVTVTGEGLYWKIFCRCSLYADVMQDLVARAGEKRIKLGLLAPEGDSYCLRTRIPKKELHRIEEFCLQPRHEKLEMDFYPIKPEEPFAYLHRLENAYLRTEKGQFGIIIEK